jgi:hypothetical protein
MSNRSAFFWFRRLQSAALSKQHGHRCDEKEYAAADREGMNRNAEIRQHSAAGYKKKQRDAKSDQDGPNQYCSPVTRLFVFSQRDVDWHHAWRVDDDKQRHKSR